MAAEWIKKAANSGNQKAQNSLGIFYCTGFGVKQDYNKAVAGWNKSAMNGSSRAAFFLGYIYETGSGIKRSVKQAQNLYASAAKKGNVYGQHTLKVLES